METKTKKTTTKEEVKEEVLTPAAPEKDIKSMNIFEKMLNISIEMETVAKNLVVGYGKNSYKGVSEYDVLTAVKPLEAKYRIFSYPSQRKIIDAAILESVSADGSVTKKLFQRVETVFSFVNVDNPTEKIEVTAYGDGVDSQDKAPGKAMTYADKYALLKAYKIATGEDPDLAPSEPLRGYASKKLTAREELIAWAKENNKDLIEISKKYGLSKNSKDSEFRVALDSERKGQA